VSESTPTLVEALRLFHESRLLDLHTACPGVVQSYNPTLQRADVQPVLQRMVRDESDTLVAETIPVIPNVPVMFPGSGANTLTWPLQRGDAVMLVFAEGSIDKWISGGGGDGAINPEDPRRHSLSDAVAYPGILRHPTLQVGQGMVVSSLLLQLGGILAADSVIKGDAFMIALNTLLLAISGAIGTSGTPAGAAAAQTALELPVTGPFALFNLAASTFLSSKVKVE
jgi:hypothetical protein